MWRFIVALVLLGHGLIHLMGFVVYLRLGAVEGLSFPSRLLGGHLGADPAVVRVLGFVWLLAAVGFVAAAGGLVVGPRLALVR